MRSWNRLGTHCTRGLAIVMLAAVAACAKQDAARSQFSQDLTQLMLDMSQYAPRTARVHDSAGHPMTVRICDIPISGETFASVDARLQALIARTPASTDYEKTVEHLQAVRTRWHDLEQTRQSTSQDLPGTTREECITDEEVAIRRLAIESQANDETQLLPLR